MDHRADDLVVVLEGVDSDLGMADLNAFALRSLLVSALFVGCVVAVAEFNASCCRPLDVEFLRLRGR